MIGNLEPEENVMRSAEWVEKLNSALQELGWTADDELRVKIGGDGNMFGYQSDAFIVIENVTRNPVVPSQPNPELKQAHPYEEV